MKVAILWLVNERGEIMLSQRATHMDSDAGVWGPSVSGGIDEGETAEQAAVREANEELGVAPETVLPVRHLHDSFHAHADGKSREFFIFYSVVSVSLINTLKLEPNEVAAVKWVSLSDFKQIYEHKPETIIIASNKKLWAEIFENLEVATASALSRQAA